MNKIPAQPDEDEFELAPFWQPDKDSTHPNPIRGEITDIRVIYGKYGEHKGVTIRQDDGSRYCVPASRRMLAGRLEDLQPQVGENIAIKFLGEKTAKDGETQYFAYGVKMPDRPKTFDWGTNTVRRDVERTGESDFPVPEPEINEDTEEDPGDVPF